MFSKYRLARDGITIKQIKYFVGLWGVGNCFFLALSFSNIKRKRPKHIELPPPPDSHRLSFFERNAVNFDKIVDKFDDSKVVATKTKVHFAAAKGHVLEIGAGTGRHLENLRKNPKIKSLTLVDISDRMCDVLEHKIKEMEFSYPVCVMRGDFGSMAFDSNSFDTVISSFTLCSIIGSTADAMAEISRVCKVSGRLLFFERGVSAYSFFRWLLRVAKIAPNPHVPWILGHFEDRRPDELVAKYMIRKYVKYHNFGMLYAISGIKSSRKKHLGQSKDGPSGAESPKADNPAQIEQKDRQIIVETNRNTGSTDDTTIPSHRKSYENKPENSQEIEKFIQDLFPFYPKIHHFQQCSNHIRLLCKPGQQCTQIST